MIARCRIVAVIAAAAILSGCAPKFEPPPDYKGGFLWDSDHSRSVTVGSGDTLYTISRRYDVPTRVIVARNDLQPPYSLTPGQVLVLDPVRTHVVTEGETLSRIAGDYHVPQSLIVEANELQPPYTVRAGQSLWIPDPFMVAAAEPVITTPQPRPGGDLVMRADGTSSFGGTPSRPSSTAIVSSALPPPPGAAAIPGSPGAPQTVPSDSGAPVVISKPQPDAFTLTNQANQPLSTPMTSAPAPVPPASPPSQTLAPSNPPVPTMSAPPAPLPRPPVVASPPQPDAPANTQTAMAPAQAAVPPVPAPSASTEPGVVKFVWPVKGRLVSGFGPAGQGLHNDGVNIAAPQGTQVRAVAAGTVVYAGSELKGFGNLLLLKHDNGLTTAYAHADKLLVSKGDAVKQGQVIATVGKSGNVDSPQLHFEVRRGTQAVDPQPYLPR